MNFENLRPCTHFLRIAVSLIIFAGLAGAQDEERNLGQQRQGLVGGTVVSPPTDSTFGRMAIVSGPFGEVFALIAPASAP